MAKKNTSLNDIKQKENIDKLFNSECIITDDFKLSYYNEDILIDALVTYIKKESKKLSYDHTGMPWDNEGFVNTDPINLATRLINFIQDTREGGGSLLLARTEKHLDIHD